MKIKGGNIPVTVSSHSETVAQRYVPPGRDETHWRQRAACRDVGPKPWFDDCWPQDILSEDGLRAARGYCDACPVRCECFVDTLDNERGSAATARFGVFAGMTPAQRVSAEKRDTVRCHECDGVLDPVDVRYGLVWCQVCGGEPIEIGSIDNRGDRWTNRHTVLARAIMAQFGARLFGAQVPRPLAMVELLGTSPRMHDVVRVYQALVADGTLEREGQEYVLIKLSAPAKAWRPRHQGLSLTRSADQEGALG